MAKPIITETPSINLIGAGTEIKGSIQANGDIRIDGTLSGTISSSGKVIIGSTGRIEGEISCLNADISGEVSANMKVDELLTLKASAVVTGDIVTNKLAIEPGAVFSGDCKMSNPLNGNGASKA
jgi:cytoskeletal protein CcmA (bactofilin family)